MDDDGRKLVAIDERLKAFTRAYSDTVTDQREEIKELSDGIKELRQVLIGVTGTNGLSHKVEVLRMKIGYILGGFVVCFGVLVAVVTELTTKAVSKLIGG